MKSRGTATNLSNSIHQQLSIYAIAAGAVGVGVVGLAQTVEAKIVYTPADVHIGYPFYDLDLNHDGATDFTIGAFVYRFYQRVTDDLFVQPGGSNGVIGITRGINWGSALDRGAKIGAGENFVGVGFFGDRMADQVCGFGHCGHYGYWWDVTNRYLGLKFTINGKTHYGWARLSTQSNPLAATLTGYAYETIPGKAIKAGQIKEAPDDATLINRNSLKPDDPSPGAFLASHIPDKPQPATLGMPSVPKASSCGGGKRKKTLLPRNLQTTAIRHSTYDNRRV